MNCKRHELTNCTRMSRIVKNQNLNPHSEHSDGYLGHSGRQSGFSLIEALVSATIFAIAATSITGVYLSVQRLNQAARSLTAVQQNARFVMEDISKIVRNGQIDYAVYGGTVPQPYTEALYLIDRDGTHVRITRPGFNLGLIKNGNFTDYTGDEVQVLVFRVYIWPPTDPFATTGTPPDEQPTVTVFLDLQSHLNPRFVERAQIQTTVATRQYPR